MVKAHDKLAKNSEKTTEKHGKSEGKPKFWTKSAWKGLVRGGEKTRRVQRKSLEWKFARKSGGQYGVSKLRGWRKEFYCEFRWDERPRITLRRMFSHRWHGWTQMLGCAGIEQRIKPIERVPAAWDFQQRIEPIERIL